MAARIIDNAAWMQWLSQNGLEVTADPKIDEGVTVYQWRDGSGVAAVVTYTEHGRSVQVWN